MFNAAKKIQELEETARRFDHRSALLRARIDALQSEVEVLQEEVFADTTDDGRENEGIACDIQSLNDECRSLLDAASLSRLDLKIAEFTGLSAPVK